MSKKVIFQIFYSNFSHLEMEDNCDTQEIDITNLKLKANRLRPESSVGHTLKPIGEIDKIGDMKQAHSRLASAATYRPQSKLSKTRPSTAYVTLAKHTASKEGNKP